MHLLGNPPDCPCVRMVRAEGLEPPHLSTTGPKPAASTNSATRARTPEGAAAYSKDALWGKSRGTQKQARPQDVGRARSPRCSNRRPPIPPPRRRRPNPHRRCRNCRQCPTILARPSRPSRRSLANRARRRRACHLRPRMSTCRRRRPPEPKRRARQFHRSAEDGQHAARPQAAAAARRAGAAGAARPRQRLKRAEFATASKSPTALSK
jgi:hypothetical protein